MPAASFSTAAVLPGQRVAYWNEVAADALARMRIVPLESGAFSGELHADSIGELGVSTAHSSRSRLQRTRSDIAGSSEHVFLLNLALQGSFVMRQRGREGLVETGDFAIGNAAEPFEILHRSSCTAGVLRMPERLLKRHLPDPALLSGRVLSGREGAGLLAAEAVRCLCRQAELGRAAALHESVVEPVVALIASACAAQLGTTATGVAQAERRRYEILHFVETRLADPELSAGAVARRFGISDRYLRMLFAQEGESVADYVARRRLEECARRLADPRWRHCTVSEVAIAWGFNSLGSFDRVFKQRFQCTPQAFRAASLAAAAGPETSVPVKSGFRGG